MNQILKDAVYGMGTQKRLDFMAEIGGMNVVLPETTSVLSVDASTEIAVDGCFSTISVRVIAGTNATINTANIIVHKEAA